jgi:hypothetical protein
MKISKTQVFISGSVIALSLMVSTPLLRAEAQTKKGVAYVQTMTRPGGRNRGVQGSISSTNGYSFVIEKANRSSTTTVNILASSTTLFTKDGEPATFADLSSGEHVVVKGTKDAITGIISASAVHIFTQIPSKHLSFRRSHNKNAI